MALAQNPSIAALSNLVLYYDASNVKSYPGAGTSIYDMSGNNNTGTLTNGPLWSAANNGVVSFDGSNDYIASSVNFMSGFTAFTFEAWVLLSATGTAGGPICAYNRFSPPEHNGPQFGISDTGIYLVNYYVNGSSYIYAPVTIATTTNTWVHMAGSWTSGSLKIYRNGIDITSTISTSGTPPTSISSDPTVTFQVGQTRSDQSCFNGKIGLVKVYNKVLTQTEVKQNYDATKGRFINTPFVPTDISGLSLWFDADDPRTLFSNTSGTTRATTDATALALWSDKSGNGRNAYQATGASQPLLKTNILNNKNVVRFDGSNDILATAASQVANTTDGSFTAFAVAQRTTASGFMTVVNQDNSTATRCSQFLNFAGNGNVESIGFVGGTPKFAYTSSGTISLSNFYILESTASTSTISAYSNGIVGSGAVTGGNLAVPSQAVSLGAYPTGQQYLNGDIAEVLLYNSVLSLTNRIKVEQYLQNKWGVLTPFLPTQISGLAVWLDASDSGSIYQDSSGTIPAQSNNDYIGMWKDKSGNSRHATQVSSLSSRPILKTNVQNSKPAVYFDGSGTWLSNTVYSYSGATTFFIVASNNYDNGYYFDGAGANIQMGTVRYSSNTLKLWNGQQMLSDPIFNLANISLVESIWNSTSSYLGVNGQFSAVGTTNAVSLTGYTVGRTRNGSGAGTSQGNFCEILLYQGVLTLAQRQQVEAYLNQKWGVF